MSLRFECCGRNVTVKEGGLVVERTGNPWGGYGAAWTSRCLRTSEVFTVEILRKCPYSLLSIGITTLRPQEVRIPEFMHQLTPTWILDCLPGSGGEVSVNGRTVQKVLSGHEVAALKESDKLALMVTPEGELRFFLNENQLGAGIAATTEGIYGFIELLGLPGDSLRLILSEVSAADDREVGKLRQPLHLREREHQQQGERQPEGLLKVQASATDDREVRELRQPLQLRARDNQRLQQQLQESERQQEGLLELLQESERQKDELQQQLHERERELQHVRSSHQRELQHMRSSHQRELQHVRSSHQRELQSVQTENQQLQATCEQHMQEVRELAHQLADMQTQNQQLNQQLHTESQQLRTTIDQLRQQIASLQATRVMQQTHHTAFWEVPRGDVILDMQRILGTGGWGYVVEGRFRGQTVAVKCLHDLIREPAFTAVIRREIDIMTQLRHPNLVLLIAAVIDEEAPLIITELLDLSLRRAYERNRLDTGEHCKLCIFRDVASALNYLHLHHHGPIIHRDVSSANVLLESRPRGQWRAKLSDFGSAKLAREATTTGPGAAVYSAPEVRRDTGIRQTPKVDVYSYGVLLCEVGVGQFPLEGRFPAMLQSLAQRGPLLHRLVSSCTQELPDSRPAMADILADLDRALGQ